MKLMPPLIQTPGSAPAVASFADWFVHSPLAAALLDGGEPFKLFLPFDRRQPRGLETGWAGVEITITCVRRTQGDNVQGLLPPAVRGNGYSDNPHGPLQPGDFGVHSHPDTAHLLADSPPAPEPQPPPKAPRPRRKPRR